MSPACAPNRPDPRDACFDGPDSCGVRVGLAGSAHRQYSRRLAGRRQSRDDGAHRSDVRAFRDPVALCVRCRGRRHPVHVLGVRAGDRARRAASAHSSAEAQRSDVRSGDVVRGADRHADDVRAVRRAVAGGVRRSGVDRAAQAAPQDARRGGGDESSARWRRRDPQPPARREESASSAHATP